MDALARLLAETLGKNLPEAKTRLLAGGPIVVAGFPAPEPAAAMADTLRSRGIADPLLIGSSELETDAERCFVRDFDLGDRGLRVADHQRSLDVPYGEIELLRATRTRVPRAAEKGGAPMRSNGSDNGAVLFGQALTILRVSRGMNRTQLAEAAGVTPTSLGQYERGHCRPRAGALSRILEALDLPPEAIDRAQEFARHPVSDGTLPPNDRAEQRKAALRLAQECGRAVAHCCLAFMELQAGGWEE